MVGATVLFCIEVNGEWTVRFDNVLNGSKTTFLLTVVEQCQLQPYVWCAEDRFACTLTRRYVGLHDHGRDL